MARSYASVARAGLPVAPKPSVLRADAAAWTPPPRCYYCGSAADTCPDCDRMRSYGCDWERQPVLDREGLDEGYCSVHSRWPLPHAFYTKKMAEFIPHTCTGCRAKHPWRAEDCVEITGFSYEKSCFCHPLDPMNVVRCAIYHYTRLGEPKTSPKQKAEWAQAAYEKEMAFSGDADKADELLVRVLEPCDGSA